MEEDPEKKADHAWRWIDSSIKVNTLMIIAGAIGVAAAIEDTQVLYGIKEEFLGMFEKIEVSLAKFIRYCFRGEKAAY